MQIAVIEYARNVLGYKDANSSELNPDTTHPVIDLMPEQRDVEDLGGTMRLGLYPCKVTPNTLAQKVYNSDLIYERHRHRYEFNNFYRNEITDKGMVISGQSPDDKLVEMVEFLITHGISVFSSTLNSSQDLTVRTHCLPHLSRRHWTRRIRRLNNWIACLTER